MIFLYDENAGKVFFSVKGENYKYLIKVRRHQENDELYFRNKHTPNILYKYKLTSVLPRVAEFTLVSSEDVNIQSDKKLHIGWCVIDAKSVEKVLASLNEIGVLKISFIYCDRSQKNFKPDFKRYIRILEASNQQCGRSVLMEFDIFNNLGDFIKEYPDTKVFDFTDKVLDDNSDFKTVLIGCEGGFSQNERDLLQTQEIFRLSTPMVLRSESATVAVASKILL